MIFSSTTQLGARYIHLRVHLNHLVPWMVDASCPFERLISEALAEYEQTVLFFLIIQYPQTPSWQSRLWLEQIYAFIE